MNINRKLIQTIFLFCILFQNCKEEIQVAPVVNSTAPGQVSNVKVENLAGAARITYTLPKDQDLLYVKSAFDQALCRK